MASAYRHDSHALAEAVQTSLDAGLNAHIAKPLMMDEVIETVARQWASRNDGIQNKPGCVPGLFCVFIFPYYGSIMVLRSSVK